MQIDHFSQGWLTPVVAYLMSVVGSLLALRCMSRARSASMFDGWLIAAAIALGGTGIWVMHFVAMLGFRIDGAAIKYNVPITLLSALIAVVVVWIGLGLARRSGGRGLVLGGAIAGLGVGAMHYTGMNAMQTDARIGYDWPTVALSLVIAVFAATAALWFTLTVRGALPTFGAALTMGLAVAGMHYTGMYAMHIGEQQHSLPPSGAGAAQLLTPLIVGVSLLTVGMLFHLGLTEVGGSRTLRKQPAADHYWPTRD